MKNRIRLLVSVSRASMKPRGAWTLLALVQTASGAFSLSPGDGAPSKGFGARAVICLKKCVLPPEYILSRK